MAGVPAPSDLRRDPEALRQRSLCRMLARDGRAPVGAFNIARNLQDCDFDATDLRTLRRL